jgi:hypothetical protein
MTKQQNVVLHIDSRSIFTSLASFNTPEPIPLGQLYNRVSDDNGGCYVNPESFHQGIEGLKNAGLATITESQTEDVPTRAPHTTTVETALTTVQITPQGRELANKHPEWTMETQERTQTAGAGGGTASRR